jgi:hypothetical protein
VGGPHNQSGLHFFFVPFLYRNDQTGIIKQISSFDSFTNIRKEGNEQAEIVEEILKIKPVFIRRAFAEYFATLWLAKNFEKMQSYLNTKMFEPNFQIVKTFWA